MNQISATFEIYKTTCGQHLNSNRRDWQLFCKDCAKANQPKNDVEGLGSRSSVARQDRVLDELDVQLQITTLKS